MTNKKNNRKSIFCRIGAMFLTLCMILAMIPAAFAASVEDATIDFTQTGSLSIYKYDLTNAEKDGVWDSSYVSTGVYDQTVNDTLGGATRAGDTDSSSDLGNGETSNGYAIKGVEFTYVQVATIVQYTENQDGSNLVKVLYGVHKTLGADFLSALGLTNGKNRYQAADTTDKLDSNYYYYESDTLIDALAAALESNATTVKNALEIYVAANGTAMAETDENGYTHADGLALGLYLVVETAVPEMVTTTTNPFLVSVPMTSVDGSNATDGGERWIYDITVYPKNLTGIPTMEKTLREAADDTGKNDGSSDITDGYAHTGTASNGDVVEYQIISTLPSITSEATYLTCYTFIDTLSAGLEYNKSDVVLEFFTDADCTQKIASWTESDGKFTVSYTSISDGESVMTIEMTAAGLAEINTAKTVYTGADMVNSGYSDCTLRITYAATVNSDNSVVYGDDGNANEVVLTWKRTSTDYYDTLVDDSHVYTYGIDLTKVFSDGKGDFSAVEFILHNDTDDYFVIAELNAAEGIYYVTGHTTSEAEATHFVPVTSNGEDGKIIIKGLEDDTYTLTEVQTDSGYTLLRDDIEIVISSVESTELCDIYESDVLGLIQNDPRYAEIINDTGDLNNMPQKHLEHYLLTASATVDGNAVTMLSDNGSENAEAPLTVVNTRGFELPKTGENIMPLMVAGGAMMFSVVALFILFFGSKKRKEEQN